MPSRYARADGVSAPTLLRRRRGGGESHPRGGAIARLAADAEPQINDLEDELGVALFEHGARTIKLTGAGRAFLGEARAVYSA
jgi:hypothetical protein